MLTAFMMMLVQATAPAPGQTAVPPAATRPVAKAKALPADVATYLAGTWNGTGAFANGKPLASTFIFEPLHDGEALLVRHSENPPHKFAYQGLMSVDTAKGGIVFAFAANLQGGMRLFRSSGWEGDTMVFTPDTGLRSWFALERMTFTRLSPTQLKIRYEMSRDGVKWGGGDEQVFTKS